MAIRFLDSDEHGEPSEMIEPVPAGSPNVWIAMDAEAQRGLMLLLQAAQMATTFRDKHRLMPLALMSACDGLRLGLDKCKGLLNALDQPKPHPDLTDDDFLNDPPDRKAEEMAETRAKLKALSPKRREIAIERIRQLEGDEGLPPEYR